MFSKDINIIIITKKKYNCMQTGHSSYKIVVVNNNKMINCCKQDVTQYIFLVIEYYINLGFLLINVIISTCIHIYVFLL